MEKDRNDGRINTAKDQEQTKSRLMGGCKGQKEVGKGEGVGVSWRTG